MEIGRAGNTQHRYHTLAHTHTHTQVLYIKQAAREEEEEKEREVHTGVLCVAAFQARKRSTNLEGFSSSQGGGSWRRDVRFFFLLLLSISLSLSISVGS